METKPKISVILSRFPYPLEKGDKLRAYNQIKVLSENFQIQLIAFSDKKVSESEKSKLQPFCVEMHVYQLNKIFIYLRLLWAIFSKKPFQVAYFYSPFLQKRVNKTIRGYEPKHIYCQLIRVAEYVKNHHWCKKTIDYMDALSKGMERRTEIAPFYSKWIYQMETDRLKSYERRIFDYFENRIIISEQDKKHILHPDRDKIKVIPNGVDDLFFEELPKKAEFELVFVGNLSYPPNVEAVKYLYHHIILNSNLSLLLSGASPVKSVVQIGKKDKISLTGYVQDIRLSYTRAKIFVAPMMIGTGQQNKILESMALGIPCVCTSMANNAVNAEVGKSILVADNENDFMQSIELLLTNRELYINISVEARKFALENFRWKEVCSELIKIIGD